MKIHVQAKKDFLERLSTATSMQALSELIWNGLDAGADLVDIRVSVNKLGGVSRIRVADNGSGIDYSDAETLFGSLGASWKRTAQRFRGRALHGKAGQGRFKAFSLGNHIEWKTTYRDPSGVAHTFRISGQGDALEDFVRTEKTAANGALPGTEVVVTDIEASHGVLLADDAGVELAKIFAPYLSQYPSVKLTFNGLPIDPKAHQDIQREIPLDDIELDGGETVRAAVSIVEWKMPTKRTIHLCDSGGVSLHETDCGPAIKAPGFNFTAYIKSDHFRTLDAQNQLILEDLHPHVDKIMARAKDAIRTHFRVRLAQRQSHIVERWKQERIYPYEGKERLDPVEEAERQVFDIVAVNVESYLPTFDTANTESRRFMFRLLAQALRQSPESVQRIMVEVLNLRQEEQEELADLLSRTSLSAIISTARIVSDRLNFLVALENLLFDNDTKGKLLERDQLHKILEKEAWIFNEEFALSGSEQRLEEVLVSHLGKLGSRIDEPVLREGGKQGRVDLMLSRVVQPRHGDRDHLVIELKRPLQKINSEVLNQVESYAIAVAMDPRFHPDRTRWDFIVVSNEMDEHTERKTRQRDRVQGLVYDDPERPIKVWAYTWTQVIANARARLQFINAQLGYEATREGAQSYLHKAHAKFIPEDETEAAPREGDKIGGVAKEPDVQ